MGALAYEPLGPVGVEVQGLHLAAPLASDVVSDLRRLYDAHGLLLFRAQRLSPEAQTAFVDNFTAGVGAISDGLISNQPGQGKLGDAELAFHSDHSFTEDPLEAICLHAVAVEDDRSSTRFVRARLDEVPLAAASKARLQGLHARHVFGLTPDGRNSEALAETLPSYVHPAILRHPRTGEPIRFLNLNLTARLVELAPEESEALLAEACAALYGAQRIYEHRWRTGDVVLWDNVAIQHARGAVADVGPRNLQRSVIGLHFYEKYPELSAQLTGHGWTQPTAASPAS